MPRSEAGAGTGIIDDYLRLLDARLRGPRGGRADLLGEARDSLEDAAEAYRADGLSPAEAERRAVAEFGAVGELADGYQAELATAAVRTLALRVVVVTVLLIAAADLVWRGAPWVGQRPPAGYLMLSDSLDLLWIGCGLASLASYLWLSWAARRGQELPVALIRPVGRILAGGLALACVGCVTILAWSLGLWSEARTWPPMIVGSLLLDSLLLWLGRPLWVVARLSPRRRQVRPAATGVAGCRGNGRPWC